MLAPRDDQRKPASVWSSSALRRVTCGLEGAASGAVTQREAIRLLDALVQELESISLHERRPAAPVQRYRLAKSFELGHFRDVSSICQLSSGEILFGGRSGFVCSESGTRIALLNSRVTCIREAPDQKIFFGTSTGDCYMGGRRSSSSDAGTQYLGWSGESFGPVLNILPFPDGQAEILAQKGLFRVNYKDERKGARRLVEFGSALSVDCSFFDGQLLVLESGGALSSVRVSRAKHGAAEAGSVAGFCHQGAQGIVRGERNVLLSWRNEGPLMVWQFRPGPADEVDLITRVAAPFWVDTCQPLSGGGFFVSDGVRSAVLHNGGGGWECSDAVLINGLTSWVPGRTRYDVRPCRLLQDGRFLTLAYPGDSREYACVFEPDQTPGGICG